MRKQVETRELLLFIRKTAYRLIVATLTIGRALFRLHGLVFDAPFACFDELDAKQSYSYAYLCCRITGYWPDAHPDVKLTGKEAKHDLRLFVEDLSGAANVSVDAAGERVFTIQLLF